MLRIPCKKLPEQLTAICVKIFQYDRLLQQISHRHSGVRAANPEVFRSLLVSELAEVVGVSVGHLLGPFPAGNRAK